MASVTSGQCGTGDIPGFNVSRNSELSAVAMPKEHQVAIGVPGISPAEGNPLMGQSPLAKAMDCRHGISFASAVP